MKLKNLNTAREHKEGGCCPVSNRTVGNYNFTTKTWQIRKIKSSQLCWMQYVKSTRGPITAITVTVLEIYGNDITRLGHENREEYDENSWKLLRKWKNPAIRRSFASILQRGWRLTVGSFANMRHCLFVEYLYTLALWWDASRNNHNMLKASHNHTHTQEPCITF